MNNKDTTTKNILRTIILLICICCISGCFLNKQDEPITCNLIIDRFEQDFFEIKDSIFDIELMQCKEKYPSFFSDTDLDIKKDLFFNDTLRSVYDSVNLSFGFRVPRENELKEGFCHYKKYFPLDTFSIVTYIDYDFDYRYPVVFANQQLFLSLHMFLGSGHSFYNSLPSYIHFSHDTLFLPSSCFITLAGRHIPISPSNNLLESMLYAAKPYFFTQHMLPHIDEYQLLKCEPEKVEWCKKNESIIWQYMIENEFLFSSSAELIDRFVSLAPFSKFGLDIDSSSPGGVGGWVGLQILHAYAKNNNVSLIDVLNETDYMKILNKSGYKP